MEPESHEEFDKNDTDDEYEGKIKDDGRCDTSDAVRINGTDFDDFD